VTEELSAVEEYDESGPEIIKRFMYVNRRAPYGTIYALECLEVVLVAAAFDQDVSVVFVDDGVCELMKKQDTTDIGIKNFSKTYGALDDYDVEKIYVEKESLDARGLTVDDLVIPVEVVAADELRKIMSQQDVVISS
jgi:tRNA 2-thiouridine synthesizing protein C